MTWECIQPQFSELGKAPNTGTNEVGLTFPLSHWELVGKDPSRY